MKFVALFIIIGFVFLVIGTPAIEANPGYELIITEIGGYDSWRWWLEFATYGADVQIYQLEVDGQILDWDYCDIVVHGDYTVVYPVTGINAGGGVIHVIAYHSILQEIAYGSAGRQPELPYNGSMIVRLIEDPEYHFYYTNCTINCGTATPGEENPIFPLPVDSLPQFVLNEIYLPSGDVNQRFIELYNPTSEVVDISGWSLYINNCDVFAAGTELQPYEFRTFTVATKPLLQDLLRVRDQIGLIGPDTTYYFTVKWTRSLDSGYSWNLMPDGDVFESGDVPYDLTSFYVVQPATPGGPNGGNMPPASFSLLSPAYGSTCWTLDTLLVWETAVDPDSGDAVTYEVWLDTMSYFSTAWEVASGLQDTSFLLEDLWDDDTFYWRVHASDSNTAGTWSSTVRKFFTYLCELPSQFSLLEPENGAIVPLEEIAFCWQAAHDPDPNDEMTYSLWLAYEGTVVASFAVGPDTCFIPEYLPPLPPPGSPIEWWISAHSDCPDTSIESCEHFTFYPSSSTAKKAAVFPEHFSLSQNYPNPFNASTTFQFTVPETSPVKISVYDIEGREVTTLTNRSYMPG
ncbi:hypothetical protein KKB28_03940, partial [bacterium]|nr:hypothetical protein [bacterium]